jgi:adenylate cyclase
MGLFHSNGPRTRRLLAHLRRRSGTAVAQRPARDTRAHSRLFQQRAVVFTDTADFTARTLRDGILHFLMLFERLVTAATPVLRRAGGEIVKVEGDSLLLRFPDVTAACRGVRALDALLVSLGTGRPHNERLRFSYGIGYGEVLDLEGDMFGLEVNLASKLGEDLARPGEALLTPAAAAALDAEHLRDVVPYRIVTFGGTAIPVNRLKLRRSARTSRRRGR